MDLGSLLFFLALLLLAALFVARPLFAGAVEEEDARLEEALARSQRAIDALVELDADWQLGKVPEEIYHLQRQQLRAEGAAALKALEGVSLRADEATEADEDLEALIRAYKKKRSKRK